MLQNISKHTTGNGCCVVGPPGCGKTFIGVTIAQLLLTLTPKLEKPILILTYKNHALDEFLVHMLQFCKAENIVRIGGRSKELKLQSCNLKNIENCIDHEKATYTEIENMKIEINDIESKIKNALKQVDSCSYLTKRSLVDNLNKDQITSLIVEAGWGRKPVTYKWCKGKSANKKWVKELLKDICYRYGSIEDFLHTALRETLSEDEHAGLHCIKIFHKAFEHWFPDRKELQNMKKFQTEFILQMQCDKTTDDTSKEFEENKDGDNSEDEDYVNQLLEMRMQAAARKNSSSEHIVMFESSKAKNAKAILIRMSDYPSNMAINSQIRSVKNLWSLTNVQRLQFLYCILNEQTTSVSQTLNDLVENLHSLKNRKEELEMTGKVEMLSKKKIIGMTITGASINHDLIHRVRPSVVIVEEAAEILEPSLLAALTPSLEHLILIGDHKQLRPQVDTYELCRNYQFDVSMMERLIKSGFPYKSLTRQNRMRPEFSDLLRDIYPNLKNNVPLVLKNDPLKCIEKSMFFWSHDDPEKKDRTFINVKEAERILALVVYLLWNGVSPSDITVLAAYLGQTKLLRNLMKQLFNSYDKDNKGGQENFVQVQTIDNYQGDENKYVIVSLVRSNKENNIGFLNKMNRRCVAQSRAKCGMYFVGNVKTFMLAKNSCWSELIASMRMQDCVGNEFPLQCTKHKESKYKALDCNSIGKVNDDHTLLCKQECGDFYPYCDEHPCRKPCFPRHDHKECPEIVDDQFPDCGHHVQRKCPQKISYIRCDKIVNDHFPDCGHAVKRKCPEKISNLRCKTIVSVDLPCHHKGRKQCFQNVSDIICKVSVLVTLPRCGHKKRKACHVKIETIQCERPCMKMNSCGVHRCKNACGKIHDHDICPEKIDYQFPECHHPSSKKKKCSEEIKWKCTTKVYFMGACNHLIERKCCQSENEVKCLFPCEKLRKCDHPCMNICGDECEKGECEQCLLVYRKHMEEFRKVAKKRVKKLEKRIKKEEIFNFSLREISSTGHTAAEYKKVKHQVTKFIQPCHKWFPEIIKIEKVTNLVLEKKFEAAKSKAFGDNIDTKFHGTDNGGLNEIIRNGFKTPETNPQTSEEPGMYGQGIYFATGSSKSAREIYTKDSQKLLLCEVILGKSMTVEKPDSTLNKEKLIEKKCDSVYAPAESDVTRDEFVIFDPDQALPAYIIHFSDSNKLVPPSALVHTNQSFTVENREASRSVNFDDPFEMYYNFAESHFRRMAIKSTPPLTAQETAISSIDIVINKDLEEKFEATKQNFKRQGIPDKEILAYHGTHKKNIESILKSNLQLRFAQRQAYGKGNYFSEFPSVSLGYGDGSLLLCRILPGKEFIDRSERDIPEGYNSKKLLYVNKPGTAAANNANGKMIIIENSDQILPFFVIYRQKDTTRSA